MTKTSSDKKKISANCLFNKGLISRIYKEFSKYNGKKKIQLEEEEGHEETCY